MPENTEKINKKINREKVSPERVPEREEPEAKRKKEIEVPKPEEIPEVSEKKPLPTPPPPPEEEVAQQARKIKTLDSQHQVKVLTDLAFQKGLSFSIRVARSLDNDYVLDEFHSTLVDKLYKELVERGRLKKI